MEVTINKSEIYKHVAALTAHIGRAYGDYVRLASSDDHAEMLNLFLPAAVAELEAYLHNELRVSNDMELKDAGDSLTFMFRRGSLDTKLDGLLATSLRLYVAYYVLSRWYLAYPDMKELAESYLLQAANYKKGVGDALSGRSISVSVDYTTRYKDGCWTREGVLRTESEVFLNEEGLPMLDAEGRMISH